MIYAFVATLLAIAAFMLTTGHAPEAGFTFLGAACGIAGYKLGKP